MRGPGLEVLDKCPKVKVIINDDLTWTTEDDKHLNRAKDGCKEYFGPMSCLYEFIKIQDRTYHAKCKQVN